MTAFPLLKPELLSPWSSGTLGDNAPFLKLSVACVLLNSQRLARFSFQCFGICEYFMLSRKMLQALTAALVAFLFAVSVYWSSFLGKRKVSLMDILANSTYPTCRVDCSLPRLRGKRQWKKGYLSSQGPLWNLSTSTIRV